MPWERDYAFRQTGLLVRMKTAFGHDTFCCALVVGWLTERPRERFRDMTDPERQFKDQLDGLRMEANRLHRAQIALREKKGDGVPDLLASRGLTTAETREDALTAVNLATAVFELFKAAPRSLITIQGTDKEESHALGVRIKATRMEFFDPNYGVYYGDPIDPDAFQQFLGVHLIHYPNFRNAFEVRAVRAA